MIGTEEDRRNFRRILLAWYKANHRDLPWRRARDPYRIWISEIMLQQTRVAVVIERYRQFLRRFPSVRRLAHASESSVLAEWSGLGYYRRARNLHATAKVIVREQGGRFPDSAARLRELPGIGRYTSAAIASIAFREPVAVVDGNVERVLARVSGQTLGNDQTWLAAQELLDARRPGDFNQAMMELGAMLCLPGEPRCEDCPVRKFCRTQGRSRIRVAKSRQKKRNIAYALARREGSVLLVRRPANASLMPGMWELPEVTRRGRRQKLFSVKHSITVTNFKVDVFEGKYKPASGAWVKVNRLNAIPLTGLTRKILRRAGVV